MSVRATIVKLMNKLDLVINPATEDSVIGVKPLSGASKNGTTVITVANTWYKIPATVPFVDYCTIIVKENTSGEIRWSGNNVDIPSSTNGTKLLTGTLTCRLAGNKYIYIASSVVGDIINWETIEI